MTKYGKEQRTRRRYWVWTLLLIILLLTVTVRIRLLTTPLERDEGDYAYMGQLILQGIPPFAGAYELKMPGLYAIYALIMAIFGRSIAGIRIGIILVNAGTILLLFFVGKRLFGDFAGFAAASSYALLSLGQNILGLFANAEHFIVLAVVAGLVLLLRALDFDRLLVLFFSGILFGMALIIKQQSVLFIAFGGFYLVFRTLRDRPVIWRRTLIKWVFYGVGAVLPLIITCLILWASKVFDKFWFWTYIYPKAYSSQITLFEGLKLLKQNISPIISQGIFIWILAGLGFVSLFLYKKARRHAFFILTFLLLSFLSVCPGLYFRTHYFILLLPAVSILAGVGTSSFAELFIKGRPSFLKKALPALLGFVVLFQSVFKQSEYLFRLSPERVSRAIYGLNPFPESLKIAEYIKNHSTRSDTIAVLGSEPQIFFYSDRRSATKHIVVYPLMLKHRYVTKMQQEMIWEIESARPKYLIFVSISTSWMINPDSDKTIFAWFSRYQQKYYKRMGVIDLISEEKTVYRWGQEALGYSPQSQFWVAVFERID